MDWPTISPDQISQGLEYAKVAGYYASITALCHAGMNLLPRIYDRANNVIDEIKNSKELKTAATTFFVTGLVSWMQKTHMDLTLTPQPEPSNLAHPLVQGVFGLYVIYLECCALQPNKSLEK